jgi:tripartite-type tricarboxylate transporter receptor subunit TctC
MNRRTLLLGASTLATASISYAQAAWPGDRLVRIIQPSQAGSPAEIYAKMFAEHCKKVFGGSFAVESKAGGTGSIGTAEVARSAPDGWTILMTSNTSHVVAPLVLRNLPYDPVKSFSPIAGMYHYGMALIVNASIPVSSTAEFVQWSKQRSGGVNMASVGTGSVGHLMAERFHVAAGFERNHVPYRGGPSAVLGVANGECDYIMDNLANSGTMLREGKLKALALTGSVRSKNAPEIPLLAEAGFPGFVEEVWFGLWGPAGMDTDLIRKLNAENAKWQSSDAVVRRMAEVSHESILGDVEAFQRYWMDDVARWTKIVGDLGIQAE